MLKSIFILSDLSFDVFAQYTIVASLELNLSSWPIFRYLCFDRGNLRPWDAICSRQRIDLELYRFVQRPHWKIVFGLWRRVCTWTGRRPRLRTSFDSNDVDAIVSTLGTGIFKEVIVDNIVTGGQSREKVTVFAWVEETAEENGDVQSWIVTGDGTDVAC